MTAEREQDGEPEIGWEPKQELEIGKKLVRK
jgi:hypothetical protein